MCNMDKNSIKLKKQQCRIYRMVPYIKHKHKTIPTIYIYTHTHMFVCLCVYKTKKQTRKIPTKFLTIVASGKFCETELRVVV